MGLPSELTNGADKASTYAEPSILLAGVWKE